jgi:excisionase family DNA binding protein
MGTHPTNVYAMIRRGVLPAVRRGRRVSVRVDALDAWERAGGAR